MLIFEVLFIDCNDFIMRDELVSFLSFSKCLTVVCVKTTLEVGSVIWGVSIPPYLDLALYSFSGYKM